MKISASSTLSIDAPVANDVQYPKKTQVIPIEVMNRAFSEN